MHMINMQYMKSVPDIFKKLKNFFSNELSTM